MKKIYCLFIFLFLFLISCKAKTNVIYQDVKAEKEKVVSLVAVGDNLIHKTIYEAAKTNDGYDFKPIYQEIKPFINKFDLKFINQETIIGGEEIGLSTYPCFNSPYELGDAVVDAGFNLISIANNHTLDRGEEAILNTLEFWNSKKVIFSGSVNKSQETNVKTFEINDIKFAFIAYTYGTNGIRIPENNEYLVNVFSYNKAKEDIENINKDVDVIIVSMHWGKEYESFPNDYQKNQAQFLSDLGVDIIIGHHPHVIQPVDMLKNKNHENTFVIYSLGNFLSDQKGIDKNIGAAVSLEIVKKGKNIELRNPQATLLYPYKNIYNAFFLKFYKDVNETLIRDYDIYYMQKITLLKSYFKEIDVY